MRFFLFVLSLATAAHGADLTLSFQLRWRGAPLAVPSANLPGADGQQLRVTRFAALVSGVALVRAAGGAVQLDGQYGFLNAETGRLDFTLRNVPAGDYSGLEFQLGLPAALNHADPARWPAGHPLNPIVNGLHWGWSGGYIFVALEGRWHTAATPEAERGFSYHLATDAHLMHARFLSLYNVSGPTTVRFALDLGKVLDARQLSPDDGSETTHSGQGDALATQLATAVERAFFFLETVPTAPVAPHVVDHARAATSATPHAFTVPTGFPQPELPADNPLTVEGVELGRRLFNDHRLSAHEVQSCASCHRDDLAFSDGRALSPGAEGTPGKRSAMPLFNLAWSPAYAWDGAKPRVRDQVLAALTGAVEMHGDPATVVAALAADAQVHADFAAAFGTPEITLERISLALEQYTLTLIAADSKFDRTIAGQAQFTDEEKRGFELFLTEYDPVRGKRGADCFHCHGGALFTDYGYHDNGLRPPRDDAGRATATNRATDRGKFKTPSLRNVAVTAPYMHDGRFKTLEEVVAHYDHGVSRNATLDPNLAKHPDSGLQLSTADQKALVAFLRTLTDTRYSAAK